MLKQSPITDLATSEENLLKCHSKLKDSDNSPKKTKTFTNKKPTKNKRVLLDCIVCLAFIQFEWNEWQLSHDYFISANKIAK